MAAAVVGTALISSAALSAENDPCEWPKLEDGFKLIYDGKTTDGWKQAGPGKFEREADCSLRSVDGMGLFWYSRAKYKDFVLRADWKAEKAESNSGIFVRFPDPQGDPWKPVNEGYEIQIQDSSAPVHRTGAIYSFAPSIRLATKPIGEWNTMEIQVKGQVYTVKVNGQKVNEFNGQRSTEGYVGLQNHGGGDKIWFRNIRIKPLKDGAAAKAYDFEASMGITDEWMRHWSDIPKQ